jgi:cytochrome c oxidase assembly protein subunit 15
MMVYVAYGLIVLHLALASVLLATLIVAGLQVQRGAGPAGTGPADATYPRWAVAAAVLGFLTLVLGGLVANTGAAPLCQGFPLCNGRLIPEGGGLVHLHWTHRLLGYALLIVVAVSIERTVKQGAPSAVLRTAVLTGLLVVAQIAVAATLVLLRQPGDLRAAHLAVGAALWAALVVWTTLAIRQTATQPIGKPAGATIQPVGG